MKLIKDVFGIFYMFLMLSVFWGGHYQVIKFLDLLFETNYFCYDLYDVQSKIDYTSCDDYLLSTSAVVAIINAYILVYSGMLTQTTNKS